VVNAPLGLVSWRGEATLGRLQALDHNDRRATGCKPSVPGRFFVDTEGGDKVAENPEGDPRNALAGERTSFAKFRTSLALDRTTLAWIRTTLTFATFGLGMIGYFRAVRQATQDERAVRLHQAAIKMGVALVVVGSRRPYSQRSPTGWHCADCAAGSNSSYLNGL
jgi:uncharacterized membrane protein YidH (DUF202 family)